jgi:hypothetical protein
MARVRAAAAPVRRVDSSPSDGPVDLGRVRVRGRGRGRVRVRVGVTA